MKDLDISKIFGSRCRAKILERLFLENSSWRWNSFYMRELSRDINEQIHSVKRELDNLSELWILKSKTEMKKKLFFINPNFELIDEFTNIFIKIYNPIEKLKEYFKTKDSVELVLTRPSIYEKFKIPLKQQKKDLDIFIIWDFNKEDFRAFLDDIYYWKKVTFATMTVEEFFNRLEFNDKMVKNLLTEKWSIYLKDNMKVKEKLEK